MEYVLQRLGWKYHEFSNRFQGCCPIHGGDNPTAVSIYKESGVWNCFTHGCHKKHGPMFPHFVKAYIEKNDGDVVELEDINDWLKENAGNFAATNTEIKTLPKAPIICEREVVLAKLEIPSKYYLSRGFSKEILKRHDVGLSSANGMMKNRNIIPIYNHSFTGVIGCSGRLDTNDKALRWRHSKNFPRDLCLYNSWFAESYVKSSGRIFITEGPAKVWKMEEAGYFNTIALLGTAFTLTQKKVLSRMGPAEVVIIMDNDNAGRETAANIADELSSLYKTKIIHTPFDDLDCAGIEEVQKTIRQEGF